MACQFHLRITDHRAGNAFPIDSVPKRLIQAYMSAEDKNFYQHNGLDWKGITSAVIRYAQVKLTGHGQIVGASTITQQVAKNFLLVGNDIKGMEEMLRFLEGMRKSVVKEIL